MKSQLSKIIWLLFLLSAGSFSVNAQIPGGVDAGLGIWLKANDNGGVTTNGTTMTSWTDKSGNGFDLTAAHSPTYTTNAINFNPTILLLNNDRFNVNSPSIDLHNSTMYIVGKPGTGGGGYNELWTTSQDANAAIWFANIECY